MTIPSISSSGTTRHTTDIYRDYVHLGATQGLCPQCLAVVPVKIIDRGGRVYFRKHCPTHGLREDFVCSDAAWFDHEVARTPGKVPPHMAIEPQRGCPYDCGLCTEHEQHTCLALLEITQNCNLTCPMCFAASGPGGQHLSYDDCCQAIDALVRAEGRPEVLQLSGGEPTVHPDFLAIHDYACRQPIDVVMVNTNGIRLAKDAALVAHLTERRKRTEVYLQFDGFGERPHAQLRGEDLTAIKLQAIDRCGEAGINITLVMTLTAGVNLDQVGAVIDFAIERPWITGVSLQPATYVGRHFKPDDLEQRVTFPDALRAACEQSRHGWQMSDFTALPCAHPNAHTIAYAYRRRGTVTPIARLIDLSEHIDLLNGRITFDRPRARQLIGEFLSRQCCGTSGCCDSVSTIRPLSPEGRGGERGVEAGTNVALQLIANPSPNPSLRGRGAGMDLAAIGVEFVERAMTEALDPADVFRITTTSFMDAYTFDIRQLMRSCVHFVLPSGHIIPFSAYNVLYRDGHVPLPPLRNAECKMQNAK